MIDTLVYTFTKKFSTEEKLPKIVKIYRDSYLNNRKLYNIKLYTDVDSIGLFSDLIKDIEIINSEDFVLLNDLKFLVLPTLNPNELLCDGDIFIREKLKISFNCDVISDFTFDKIRENIKYFPHYETTPKLFIENGIQEVIPYFNDYLKYSVNIGFLYFVSKDIEQKYLSDYKKLRNWFIDNKIDERYKLLETNFNNISITSQYLLALVCDEYGAKIEPLKPNNIYQHFAGPLKYKNEISF